MNIMLAVDGELDRAIELAGGGGGQRGVRPGKELASEAGAEEAGDDLDVFARHAERFRHDMLVIDHALRGFVEVKPLPSQTATVACISMGLWVSAGVV
jgi:hypothetical protein